MLRNRVAAILAAVLVGLPYAGDAKNILTRRLFFYRGSLKAQYEPDRLCGIMESAAKSGYNALLLQQGLKGLEPKAQLNKVKEIRATADRLKITIIPSTMHQTHASKEDGSVSEAFPVLGTQFEVKDGIAHAVPEPGASLPSNVGSWKPMLGCKINANTFREGKGVRIENPQPNVTLVTQVTLKPFRAYELSVMVKTENYAGYLQPFFQVLVGNDVLLWRRDRCFMSTKQWSMIAKSMDWKKCSVSFNSLENASANIRLSAGKKGGKGKIWFANTQIREKGLHQMVRRSTLPVVVKSEDGSQTYKEGVDYVVGKEKLTIPTGSAVQNGQLLRVDWFQCASVETLIPPASLCHQRPWDILEDEAGRYNKILGPARAWNMEWDEWRVAFWDPACIAAHKNAGKYKGWVSQTGEQLLRKINPNMEVYVWGGMYDPYHQGRDDYWMNNTTAKGAWNGLGDSTIVFSWNGGGKSEALRFFGGKDPAYPSQTRSIRQGFCVWGWVQSAVEWLKEVEKAEKSGVKNIIGMLYISWQTDENGHAGNFRDLGASAEIFRKAGRWGTNSLIDDLSVAASERNGSFLKADMLALRWDGQGAGIVEYTLSQNAHVRMDLFDAQGRKVRELVNGRQKAGTHQIRFPAEDISKGVYFVRLALGDKARKTIRRILLM